MKTDLKIKWVITRVKLNYIRNTNKQKYFTMLIKIERSQTEHII